MQGAALEALVEALQNEEEAQEIVNQAQQVLHLHMSENSCVSLRLFSNCPSAGWTFMSNGLYMLVLRLVQSIASSSTGLPHLCIVLSTSYLVYPTKHRPS